MVSIFNHYTDVDVTNDIFLHSADYVLKVETNKLFLYFRKSVSLEGLNQFEFKKFEIKKNINGNLTIEYVPEEGEVPGSDLLKVNI